jgi:hypothetical protein
MTEDICAYKQAKIKGKRKKLVNYKMINEEDCPISFKRRQPRIITILHKNKVIYTNLQFFSRNTPQLFMDSSFLEVSLFKFKNS